MAQLYYIIIGRPCVFQPLFYITAFIAIITFSNTWVYSINLYRKQNIYILRVLLLFIIDK